jgi:hypothetical protein
MVFMWRVDSEIELSGTERELSRVRSDVVSDEKTC